MKTIWRHLRVLATSSVVAVLLYIATFFAVDFVYLHFVVTDPGEFGSGRGFVLWLYSFLLGSALAGPAFVRTTWRMWPTRRLGR